MTGGLWLGALGKRAADPMVPSPLRAPPGGGAGWQRANLREEDSLDLRSRQPRKKLRLRLAAGQPTTVGLR